MSGSLAEKITHRTAQVAVIGLGYVGLPLAIAAARAGFRTLGVEVNPERVAAINNGQSYIEDVSDETIRSLVQAEKLKATADYDRLRESDVIFICVPTPYTAQRTPDLRYIIQAAEGIMPRLHPQHLVVLQSTTYPGTTVEVVKPILERGGLSAERDFYLAFSPERIDPGNKRWSAYNTPKVVGGLTEEATAVAAAFLRQMGAPVHEVSSPDAAELTKLLENTFRAVNIALVNELALLAERMGIDFWEVIEAAKSKPFGFMPFYPGAGVGGHCIPIDPYYLLWKAREYDFYTHFIELAAETNEAMPYHLVELTRRGLGRMGKAMKGSRVLVLGVAFKADIGDARNSPALRVIELLLRDGAEVRYHDPYVPHYTVGGDPFIRESITLESAPLNTEMLHWADSVIIVTGHRAVDYSTVVEEASLVIDSCNATATCGRRENVIRLGAPFPQ